jgi:antirestriction protein ArdC
MAHIAHMYLMLATMPWIPMQRLRHEGGLITMASKIYSQVNYRIIAALEKGNIPWKRPWTG